MTDQNVSEKVIAHWKCHTPNLLAEILENPGTGILHIPLKIFRGVIHEVATRASELNDPILNELMCRLALYSIADPTSSDYDPAALELIEEAAKAARLNKNVEQKL